MLNETLKKLMDYGMIKRKVYPEVPPRVEYFLSDFDKPRQSDSAAANETVEELTSELHALKEQYTLKDSITLKFTVIILPDKNSVLRNTQLRLRSFLENT